MTSSLQSAFRFATLFGYHEDCPCSGDEVDALAKQAAATHPLQLRPSVLRRPGEPLAPLGSRSVRQKGTAEGVSQIAVAVRRHNNPVHCADRESNRPSRGLAMCARKRRLQAAASVQMPVSVSQQAQPMHPGGGRESGKGALQSMHKYINARIRTR